MDELVTIIGRRRKWYDFNIKQLSKFRDLLLLFALRDIKVRYKQTLLGPMWLIVQPLTLTAVFTITMGRLAGVSTDGVPPPLFYFTALIAFQYFSYNVQSTGQVFLSNEHLFSKIYFPRIILPLSTVLSGGVALLIQLLTIIGLLSWYWFNGSVDGLSWRLLLFPLIALHLACFSLAVGLCIAASTAKYRDLSIVTPFLLQLWLFITPVIYPFSAIPERYRTAVALFNPLSVIVEEIRWSLLGVSKLDATLVIAALLGTLVLLAGAFALFNRVERTAMDTI
jgi:lipopolysaccharide transport system permease protein